MSTRAKVKNTRRSRHTSLPIDLIGPILPPPAAEPLAAADLLEAIRLQLDPASTDSASVQPALIDAFKSLVFETVYLEAFTDVAAAAAADVLFSGYAHWAAFGRQEILDQSRTLATMPDAGAVRAHRRLDALPAEIQALAVYIDDWARLFYAFATGTMFKRVEVLRQESDLPPLPVATYSAASSVLSVVTPGLAQYYAAAPQIVAFYLPQYHRVAENDEWWGEGFTEWTNVRRAKPNFEGHGQPHVPRAQDYYDLADPAVQRRQTKLATEYGIRAFCYYMYWFDGRRLLERPLDHMLEDKTIQQEFCVCWANENWTRTWDGKADDVLLGQVHTLESNRRFIQAAFKYLADPRYLRIDGKLALLVYRVDLLGDANATAEIWRNEVRKAGLGELHLCAVQFYGVTDPAPWGFDAAVEFPPHGWIGQENLMTPQPKLLNPDFKGYIFDYDKAVDLALSKPIPDYRWYRGVFPGWDNTARRQDTPHIFANANPFAFQRWLTAVLHQAAIMAPAEHQFVFVNAWNEWGEGAHLEPDEADGAMNLMALNSALRTVKEQAWVLAVLSRLRSPGDYPDRGTDELSLLHHMRGQEQSLRALSERLRATGLNPYL